MPVARVTANRARSRAKARKNLLKKIATAAFPAIGASKRTANLLAVEYLTASSAERVQEIQIAAKIAARISRS